MALQQYKVGGTYYGYDPLTGQGIAFPDEKSLKKVFPNGIDPKAMDLPVDPTVFNASPNQPVMGTPYVAPGTTVDNFDPTQYGITPAMWTTLTPADKAFVESIAGTLKSQYDAGQTNVSINQDLLNKALTAAQNDPNIIAKYGDAAKAAASDINFNLGQINANYATAQTQQQLEMAQQRKDLEEQIAAGGQAYSGFRKQAENILGSEQANIIQSSKSALQQKLQDLGRGYESTFGSTELAKLPSLNVGAETYNPLGNITGTAPLAQKADILNRQNQIFNQEYLTK